MNQTRRDCALRLLLAWGVLSALGFWLGPRCLEAIAPSLTAGVRLLQPELTSQAGVAPAPTGEALVLETQVAIPVPMGDSQSIPTGTPIRAEVSVIHALVPVVLLLSVSAGAPARNWRERALACAIAVPLAVATAWMISLLHLLGLIQLQIQMTAEQLGIAHQPGVLLNLLLFLEGGGRWLLPALLGLFPGALARGMHGAGTVERRGAL